MRAFSTVAINVFAVVVMALDRVPEEFSGELNFFTDFREVREFQRSAVALNQIVHVNSVKVQPVLLEVEAVLWEVESLGNEVVVCIFHQCAW